VGANIGVRLSEGIDLQQEGKKELKREKESGTESKVNSYSQSRPPRGCPRGSIYRGG
jgi:hypothetical protein